MLMRIFESYGLSKQGTLLHNFTMEVIGKITFFHHFSLFFTWRSNKRSTIFSKVLKYNSLLHFMAKKLYVNAQNFHLYTIEDGFKYKNSIKIGK